MEEKKDSNDNNMMIKGLRVTTRMKAMTTRRSSKQIIYLLGEGEWGGCKQI